MVRLDAGTSCLTDYTVNVMINAPADPSKGFDETQWVCEYCEAKLSAFT